MQKYFTAAMSVALLIKKLPDRQFRVDMSGGEAQDICVVCLEERKTKQEAAG